jgi:hypothetical protein
VAHPNRSFRGAAILSCVAYNATLPLLRFQDIALIDPAALKEAVIHHGLAKQKHQDYQDRQ